ncbi:MAG: hypothetical protein R6U32_00410, partial [Candidatus Woesearchaeota archaeon]
MRIDHRVTEKGISIRHGRKTFRLVYPDSVWSSYPSGMKKILVDNLLYLCTINMPSVCGEKEMHYDTSTPFFYSSFRDMVAGGIPHSVEDYDIATGEALRNFFNTSYVFSGGDARIPPHAGHHGGGRYRGRDRYHCRGRMAGAAGGSDMGSAIVPFSCGKDSLLTLAVCDEIGLEPRAVYVNDTVSPSENRIKLRHGRTISRRFGFPYHIVRNEIEQLNDFDYWGAEETCVNYTHMMTNFCFITLPFMHRFGAGHVALGNQKDMDFGFINKDGYSTLPSFDQSSAWTRQQDMMVRSMTGGKGRVVSVIEP